VRLGQRDIDEGMRLDRHPGIIFRDGPAGRRAVIVGVLDVSELIAATQEAAERREKLVSALARRLGLTVGKIRIAVRYYADYPDEIDRFISMVDEEARELEQMLEREQQLLG
jgi:hypothetical protein